MYQFSEMDSFSASLSQDQQRAVNIYSGFLENTKHIQLSVCDLSRVENWSPAYDFINERSMPKITGVFCQVHCELLSSAICPGARNETKRQLDSRARKFLEAAIVTVHKIFSDAESFGLKGRIALDSERKKIALKDLTRK